MKLRHLLSLTAIALTSTAAWAQSDYEFVASEWPAGDDARIQPSEVTVDADANVIYVNPSADGQNNVALIYRGPARTVSAEQRFFAIKGTNLATGDGDSFLWWLNNENNGSHKPGYIFEEDGQTVLAWDILSLPTQLSSKFNIYNSTSTLTNGGGWSTTFGLTQVDNSVPAEITYIGFLTADEVPGVEPPAQYSFVPSQWVAGDAGRISPDNVEADDAAGTITVNKTGQNNIALLYKPGKVQYVTPASKYFVIKGTGLSLTEGDTYLWWLNNTNNGTQIVPYLTWTDDEGRACFAWDIATSGIGSKFSTTTNTYLNYTAAWTTTFGLTLADPAVPAVISYIGFDAELPAVIEVLPYSFDAADWVAGDPGRISASNVSIEDGKIVASSAGANNVALRFKTANFYSVDPDQLFFIVRATGLSTVPSDSKLWWLNGANHGSEPLPNAIYEEDGEVVLAWDIAATGLDDNFSTTEATQLIGNGDWNTTFGLTQADAAVPVVFSYIGFAPKAKLTLSEADTYRTGNTLRLADVTLERSIVADGNLSTIVLPFSLSAEQVTAAFGEGTKLYAFTGDQADGDKVTVSFAEVSTISAGQPLLIQPTLGGSSFTFDDVTVTAQAPVTEGTALSLVGTYSPAVVAQGDFVLADANTFRASAGASSVEGYRAYFHLNTPADVKALQLNLNGVATAINAATLGLNTPAAPAYNLAGQRVSIAKKGIYVIAGKKVVR